MGKRAKKDRSNTFSRGIEPCVVSDASDADRARGGWQSRGSSTAARRDRLAARTSAVSRALDGRAGRTRSRSSPRETPAIGEERATGEHSLRRPCRTGGARTRTHLSPCPSFHESLNPPAATLRSTRDMTWNGGSAASASDALVMAPAAPPGTLCQAMRAFRPSSPRAPRPPGVRPTARGRALPSAEPCPTVRTAVRRARGCGATNAAAPGLARDARRRGSRSPQRNLGQRHRVSVKKNVPIKTSRSGTGRSVSTSRYLAMFFIRAFSMETRRIFWNGSPGFGFMRKRTHSRRRRVFV